MNKGFLVIFFKLRNKLIMPTETTKHGNSENIC